MHRKPMSDRKILGLGGLAGGLLWVAVVIYAVTADLWRTFEDVTITTVTLGPIFVMAGATFAISVVSDKRANGPRR
jgi:hypothetical protein